MANPYFTPSGAPPTQTRGISASMRGEFNAIGTGFDGVYAQLVALAAAIGVPVTVTEVPVASGSTTDIGNGYGPVISITGTTTINSFGANYNGAKFIRFTGILTLTNSASLVLPGGANITTAAGDACIAIPIGNPASGWRVLSYCRMSKPMLDDDAIRASVSYSNPSWLTALAWSKISGTPTTRAGYGIVDAAGNGNNSDITSLSGLSGNIAFTGIGNRITGDFSNATVASRVAFQSSTVNGATVIDAIPNGTGNIAGFIGFNSSTPANSAYASFSVQGATDVRLDSGALGTGTRLPLTFYTGGAESARLDTSGNFGIGTPSPTVRLNVVATVPKVSNLLGVLTPNPASLDAEEIFALSATAATAGLTFSGADARFMTLGVATDNSAYVRANALSFYSAGNQIFNVAGTERMRIDAIGYVGVGTAPSSRLHIAGSNVALRWTNANATPFTRALALADTDNSFRISRPGVADDFVFGASGQLGIAGANYGTAGQVFTSGGPSAAPSWTSVGTTYTSAATPLPGAGSAVSVAHGLAAAPTEVWIELTCLTAEAGYAAGEVIINPLQWDGTYSIPVAPWKSSTNVGFNTVVGRSFGVAVKTAGGGVQTLTLANWSYRIGMRTT